MPGVVAILGTFDTKREELDFLTAAVERAGAGVLRVDCSLRGEPSGDVDIGPGDVARAAGLDAEAIASLPRGEAVAAMGAGVAALALELVESGRVQAVAGAGGGTSASLFGAAARELPFGLPKLLVSTVAAGDPLRFVGGTDTLLLHPVADLEGLNPLTRSVLRRAGRAIGALAAAAAEDAELDSVDPARTVAATMFGITTPCVSGARRLLTDQGREVVVFHATGTGGRAYERFVAEGRCSAVLDATTTELADEVAGGVLSAGPERLTAAGRRGIPQVVCPGAVDAVNFRGPESVPDHLRGRRFLSHNPHVTLMRTDPAESAAVGRLIAERVGAAAGPAVVALPLRGVSALDAPGQPFHWPEADEALFDAIRDGVPDHVELLEVDAHINDGSFSELLATTIGRLTTRAPAGR